MRACAGSAPLRIAAGVVVVFSLAIALSTPTGAGARAASVHRPPALSTIVLAEIGFGYTVTSQGPLDASRFPAGAPNAAASAEVLSTLGNIVACYQRSWQDAKGINQVQDLVVRFPTDAGARAFVAAAQRAVSHGQIVSSGPVPSIPGAQRTTYFASTNQAGVGQTVTMRAGTTVAVLSFFSGASGNPAPITRTTAVRVSKAQYSAMASVSGPESGSESGSGKLPRGGASAANMGWAVLAVAVLAAAVVTPLVLRRRRSAADQGTARERF